MIFGGPINMQILISLINYFRRKPDPDRTTLEMVLRSVKPTKVQKHQARELAEAEMNFAQCVSNEEFYRHQAAFYSERIARLKGENEPFHVGGTE